APARRSGGPPPPGPRGVGKGGQGRSWAAAEAVGEKGAAEAGDEIGKVRGGGGAALPPRGGRAARVWKTFGVEGRAAEGPAGRARAAGPARVSTGRTGAFRSASGRGGSAGRRGRRR